MGERVAPRGIAIGVLAVVNELGFQKKLSIGALSQQFSLRLIDWTIAVLGMDLDVWSQALRCIIISDREGCTLGQVLHGSATTTEAIRRAIQRNQESLRTLAMLDNIKELDRKVLHAARGVASARLFMSVPGIGPITALSVASVFDDASRFKRSSSAGAYLGLAPRRFEAGEMSLSGRISKQGNRMTRKHLYEAATTMLTRTTTFCTLKAWA